MKLKFDPNYEYQLEAIQAVVDLFDGQQTTSGSGLFGVSGLGLFQNETGTGNLLHITQDALIENLRKVQQRQNQAKAKSGAGGLIDIDEEYHGNHFSIEMETGTGKTYVYLRTMFELHQQYGLSKFVIVVPGKAIREGVLKSLEITRDHLRELYGSPEYDYFVYDSKKPGNLRNFATSNHLSVMLINIEAFNTIDNLIHNYSDRVLGTPIEFVQKSNPIVIIDEPQNMETEKAKQAIQALNPLCTLRYSATHRNLYNQIYRLTPVDAYDMGLVKRIEVASVQEEGSQNDAYIVLKEVKASGQSVRAKIEIEERSTTGEIKKKTITYSRNNRREATPCDLYEKSNGIPAYEGYMVSLLDARNQLIEFANGKVVTTDDSTGEMRDEIMKRQIEETIKEHLEKMLRFRDQDIKVLSLLFLDQVANYRDHDNNRPGKIAAWFEEIYSDLVQRDRYQVLDMPPVTDVHDGYFAKDKAEKLYDSNEGAGNNRDRDTYELIMRDKERLLSMDEPLQFIFSHSALKEGWDNPNVFQICTLNESNSYVKKRQEIGRGLRLPVNQSGERIFDRSINLLTVIANQSYDTFARSLQDEIELETGISFGQNRISDKKKRKTVKLKNNWVLDENFKALWDRIKAKTKYRVSIDMNDYVNRAAEIISVIPVRAPRIRTEVAGLDFDAGKGILTTVYSSRDNEVFEQSLPVPDVLGYIGRYTNLRKETIAIILEQADVYQKIRTNPQYAMDTIVKELNILLKRMMVNGVKYEKIAGEEYEMRLFESEEIESYIDRMAEVDSEKTLYDHVVYDSDVEYNFLQELEVRNEVKFYFKLPGWFKIDTPLGTYNPDWALVFENDHKLYLVAETKGTIRLDELKDSERLKIQSGKKHFEALDGVDFVAPVTTLNDVSERVHGGRASDQL